MNKKFIKKFIHREIMRKYLIDKKEEINGFEIVERLIAIKPSKEFIRAIIGPRRAGKSFFLFSLIKNFKLRDEKYLFINFEDDEVKSLRREEKVK